MDSRSFGPWLSRLVDLCDRVRAATREHLARTGWGAVTPPVRRGVGDVSFALDVCAEEVIASWTEEVARVEPFSILTEDTGWRHLAPDGRGGSREIESWDHGGPRLVLDPIDGTRNLMADLRSAWTVVAFAEAGAEQPSLADVTAGLLAEIPVANAASFRRVLGQAGRGARIEALDLDGGRTLGERPLVADGDARPDHGYFPFFRYLPEQRPALAAIEAEFFARLARHEGADVRSCYDDQYICNAGQLMMLALGTYRFVADLRAWEAARRGGPAVTTKPYDVAGAIVCARAAGCIVNAPGGGELAFPLDAETPVSFVGYANEATRARLEPHLRAVLGPGG